MSDTVQNSKSADYLDNFINQLKRDSYLPPEEFRFEGHLPIALERLKRLPRWVVWKWVWKENPSNGAGKWDKPPFQARNPSRFAKSNDPKTWGSFDQACAAVAADKADGIGFMLLGSPIAAFDIDDCRTVYNIDSVALALIPRAESYCEITPSGTGLRIIGTGSDRYMHTKKKVKGSAVSIEAYRNCARYITITGAMLNAKGARPILQDIDLLIDDVVAELDWQQGNGQPPPDDPPHRNDDDDEPSDDETLAMMEVQLPPDLRETIQDGIKEGEGDRSKEFHHCVKHLKDLHWTLTDIIALLKKYPNGIAQKYGKRTATEAERTFNKPDKQQSGDEAEAEEAEAEEASDTKNKKKSTLIYFDDAINEEIFKEWIIKGVIAKAETSSWIGPPKSGKSAIVTDLCISVAAGTDWRGYHSKGRCGVVYFALERGDLVKRRLRAHAKRDGLKDLPIAIRKGIIDLKNPKCVASIVATIREAESNFGCDVGLITIDTFGKAIAAGGGEENSAKDQNIVFANLRRVQEQTGVHIALIHHTGKDESRGSRGSNALPGDVDVLIQIASGKKIKTVTVTDANDQPTGVLTKFEMEIVKIGTDEDGDAITAAIVDSETDYSADSEERTLTPQQSRAMELLINTINDVGQPPPASVQTFAGVVKVVTINQWKETCRRGALTAGDETSFKRVFRRVFDDLIAKHKIGTFDDNVWVAYHDENGGGNPFSKYGRKPQP